MKRSKRQIVVSQIANSQLSTSDLQNNKNHHQHHFQNDLNIIQNKQSNLSNQHRSHFNSYLQDEDEEIIQSMNEKLKLINELQIIKTQLKNTQYNKIPNSTKNNTLPRTQHHIMSVKINTINSCNKKLSTQSKPFKSIKSKLKPQIYNSLSSKTFEISKSQKHLLQKPNSKKTEPKSYKKTTRKSINTASNSYPEIVALRKLEYDPNMLMKSSTKSYLVRGKQKKYETKINDYGLHENAKSSQTLQHISERIEVKNNSQKIPFRFQF